MRKDRFICSICYGRFSRKYNAERHNEDLHSSQAHIIPLGEFRYSGFVRHLDNKKLGFRSSNSGQTSDDQLTDALEKIGKDFEDCERELDRFPPQERAPFLARTVVFALRSGDPKQTMRSCLKGFRRNKFREKIVWYVAAGLEMTPYDAERMLIGYLD